MLIGTHLSFPGNNLMDVLRQATKMNMNCVQIFTRNPGFLRVKPEIVDLNIAAKYIRKHGIKLFIHAQYSMTFAKRPYLIPAELYSIHTDLQICDKLGGIGVVFHLGHGSHENAKRNLARINMSKYKSLFIIENQAKSPSRSTAVTVTLEDLIRVNPKKPGFAFCIDTCHLYVSGIRNLTSFLQEFEDKIGKDKLALVHLNDSMSEIYDRHADLFTGFIGNPAMGGKYDSLTSAISLISSWKIPMVIERGQSALWVLELQIKLVRDLIGKNKEEAEQIINEYFIKIKD